MALIKHALVTAALAAASFGASAATTFGFEDLTVPFHTAVSIPNGYADAQFDGFILRRTAELNGTGLNSNDGSQILAIAVLPTAVITFGAPVTFDGAFLINPGAAISYDLYLNAALVASSAPIGVNASFSPSGYAGAINRIVFHQGVNQNFSLDDLTLSPAAAVPEPQSAGLLLAGLLGMGLLMRGRLTRGARQPH